MTAFCSRYAVTLIGLFQDALTSARLLPPRRPTEWMVLTIDSMMSCNITSKSPIYAVHSADLSGSVHFLSRSVR